MLLLKPGRVIPFPRDALTAIKLKNPLSYVVQKISVVGDSHDCARKVVQVVLLPSHRFCIQVVRRLVKEEHVGLFKEYPA